MDDVGDIHNISRYIWFAVSAQGFNDTTTVWASSTIVIAYGMCIKTATAYMDLNDWYIILIVIL